MSLKNFQVIYNKFSLYAMRVVSSFGRVCRFLYYCRRICLYQFLKPNPANLLATVASCTVHQKKKKQVSINIYTIYIILYNAVITYH
jgi:hypothetical protein